jgi:predicted HTH domain antitoxin
MAELTVQYPDDLLLASGKTRSALEDQLRFELAVRLFEVGQLSIGKASELAGLSKPRFGEELGRLKIPTINLDDSEIEAELSALRWSCRRAGVSPKF